MCTGFEKAIEKAKESNAENIYIWGAWAFGRAVWEQAKEVLNVVGFIDNNPAKQGTSFCGLPVLTLNDLDSNRDTVLVTVTSLDGVLVISELLEKVGFIKNQSFFLKSELKDYAFYDKLPRDQYESELKFWYYEKTGQNLNLENPCTFNEKIQWMKLYDTTPEKTALTNKYEAKKHFIQLFGEEYVFPLLGIYENIDEIDFDALPEQFVLKSTTGSARNIIVKNKSEFKSAWAKEKFEAWHRTNFAFFSGFELHYMNVRPQILVEKFMGGLEDGLVDYRLYCFDGEPKIIWADIFSDSPDWQRNIYDMDWELIDTAISFPRMQKPLEKPQNLDKMKEISRVLAKPFCHARVDFFEVCGKLYIAEVTFTNESGISVFQDEKYNLMMGNYITLPEPKELPERLY